MLPSPPNSTSRELTAAWRAAVSVSGAMESSRSSVLRVSSSPSSSLFNNSRHIWWLSAVSAGSMAVKADSTTAAFSRPGTFHSRPVASLWSSASRSRACSSLQLSLLNRVLLAPKLPIRHLECRVRGYLADHHPGPVRYRTRPHAAGGWKSGALNSLYNLAKSRAVSARSSSMSSIIIPRGPPFHAVGR